MSNVKTDNKLNNSSNSERENGGKVRSEKVLTP